MGVRRENRSLQPLLRSVEGENRENAEAGTDAEGVATGSAQLPFGIEGMETGIWDRDVVTGKIHYSTSLSQMLGLSESELGNSMHELRARIHPDDRARVEAAMQDHFDQRTNSYRAEYRVRGSGDSYRWVSSHGRVVSRDPLGKPLRMVGAATDITTRHDALEQLEHTVELLTNLTDEIPGLVFQYRLMPDGRCCFPYASYGIRSIFGVSPQAVAASAAVLDEIIHPDDRAAYHDSFHASARLLRPWHHGFRVVSATGQLHWIQGNARPQRAKDGGTLWHGFMIDVTEQKKTEVELQQLAATDYLTGLPNRRSFMSRIETELTRLRHDRRRPAAILMIDLDHFKETNDRYGHASGDKVLKHFVGVLNMHLRKTDIAGRVGGEEFAVMLPASNCSEAFVFSSRLQHRLAEMPMREGTLVVPVTVSIGVTVMDARDASVQESLARSDRALYRAKSNGRNRIECA